MRCSFFAASRDSWLASNSPFRRFWSVTKNMNKNTLVSVIVVRVWFNSKVLHSCKTNTFQESPRLWCCEALSRHRNKVCIQHGARWSASSRPFPAIDREASAEAWGARAMHPRSRHDQWWEKRQCSQSRDTDPGEHVNCTVATYTCADYVNQVSELTSFMSQGFLVPHFLAL